MSFDKAFYACMEFETGARFQFDNPAVQQGLIDTKQHRDMCGYTSGAETYGPSHSKDLGGETKFGIAKNGDQSLDITHLTMEQAKSIYKQRYWDPMKCDRLHPEVAAYLFNISAGSWIVTAAKILQVACGVVSDGKIGHATIAAANAMDPNALLEAMRSGLVKYYIENVTRCPNNKVFLNGWTRRANTFMQVYRSY